MSKSNPAVSGLDHATRFVTRICRIAGDHRMLDHIRRDLARCGVRAAVRGRNTPALFEWLLERAPKLTLRPRTIAGPISAPLFLKP